MSLYGVVKNGKLEVEGTIPFEEGTRVRIQLFKEKGPYDGAGLAKDLLEWAGTAVDLPEDMALNHDHYLHGTPKK